MPEGVGGADGTGPGNDRGDRRRQHHGNTPGHHRSRAGLRRVRNTHRPLRDTTAEPGYRPTPAGTDRNPRTGPDVVGVLGRRPRPDHLPGRRTHRTPRTRGTAGDGRRQRPTQPPGPRIPGRTRLCLRRVGAPGLDRGRHRGPAGVGRTPGRGADGGRTCGMAGHGRGSTSSKRPHTYRHAVRRRPLRGHVSGGDVDMRVLMNEAAPEVPTPHGRADQDTLEQLYAYPDTSTRPWTRANMVATLDGAAMGNDGRTASINTEPDLVVYTLLRDLADVILVGAGTARLEGYRSPARRSGDRAERAVAEGRTAHPELAVVSRGAHVPPLL